ncbi:hypothetical protein [Streptomyces sp. WZ-12]|uniref:hypothetical protein n=1 Tax=Streptomyces sp. WZ-12 TaxID=3030210 RepID=UPI00238185C6|nr:hypothetical protein [Streptomyces sp. WZ-12]
MSTYECAVDRGPVEFTYYLSTAVETIPGVEETETWFYGLRTGAARVVNGRIIVRMHWSVDVPVEKWRAWRAEYDWGVVVQPGVRRDALRFIAQQLYSSGMLPETDAVMTVTRAREGRTALWRTIPDPIRVYRPEDRKRAGAR